MNFESLGIAPALCQALARMGIGQATPVQAEVIGPALAGADVLASAQTGSGKTLAYGLPLLQRLLAQPASPAGQGRVVRALVLVPTRELASQVGEVLSALAPGLKLALLFGGVSINPQLMALRGGADLVVATPGRLLDVVAHKGVSLKGVQQLVLDEADRLLELGFAEELQAVLALLPARRQSLLLSATFEPALQALALRLLRDPVRVAVRGEQEHPVQIRQRALWVEPDQRTRLLRHLIRQHGWRQLLVFVATRYGCDLVVHKLSRAGVTVAPFHGELSQQARQAALRGFKDGSWDVLVTTDLGARGLDIAELPVVLNYDLPRSATDHTHRIGRTGRAGVEGEAVSFVTPASAAHWALIQKRHGLVLPPETEPGFELLAPPAQPGAAGAGLAPAGPAAPGSGGIKGRRPSKKDKLRAAAAQAQGGPPAADPPPGAPAKSLT